MGYYSARKKNEFESILMRWINLEPVTLSEVSQRKENKYMKPIHMESRKWYSWTYLQGRDGDRDREIRLLDKVGEGESGTNTEYSINTHTLPRVTDSWWEVAMNTGSQARCSATTWSSRGGRLHWEGMYVYLRLSHTVVWQKPVQHCNAIFL